MTKHIYVGYINPAPNPANAAISKYADWGGAYPKQADDDIKLAFLAGKAVTDAAGVPHPADVTIQVAAETDMSRFGYGVTIVEIDDANGINPVNVLQAIAGALVGWRSVEFFRAKWKNDVKGGSGSW